MADSIRIDEMIFDASGRVRVKYTRGPAPLPAEPSGSEVEFPNKAAFGQMLADLALSDTQMIALVVAPTFKQSTSMPSALAYKGKAFTLDTSGAISAASWT